jgi:hypothetical protein
MSLRTAENDYPRSHDNRHPFRDPIRGGIDHEDVVLFAG